MFVKICGILDVETGTAAAEAGADAVGFVFAPSPRRIEPARARSIAAILPPRIIKVGVFVNEDPGRVREIAELCCLDLLQFSGDESPAYCRLFEGKAVKAFRVWREEDLTSLSRYRVRICLIDAYVPGCWGGSGRQADWGLARQAAQLRPVILAGGLTVGNVREALNAVRPAGVDVSSGVETAGKKDPDKINAFVRAVRAWQPATVSLAAGTIPPGRGIAAGAGQDGNRQTASTERGSTC